MITRKDIAAHLEAGVRTGFLQGKTAYQPLRGPFVQERPSDGAFQDYADMGAPPWPQQGAGKQGPGGLHGETGAPKVNQPTAGLSITIVGGAERSLRVYNVDWYVATAIEHNAIDDDRAGDLESWAKAAGQRFEQHKDYLCFDAINKGEATTTYGAAYNGLSFFNDAHIDKMAEYGTGQDNKFALPLSLDNYQTVTVAASKFLDDKGQPVGLNHAILVVPKDLERVAYNLAFNREAFDTGNREANPYAGRVTPIVAPGGWLDSTAWAVIDGSQPQKPLNLQMRKDPELIIWDDELATEGGVRYIKFHARYAVFYGDWRLAALGNT